MKKFDTFMFLLTIVLIFGALSNAVRSAHADYDRSLWNHWIDLDRDCINTRHELLIIHSAVQPSMSESNSCLVQTGIWLGLYTGETFFNARELDIDHVIPLSYANDHGGEIWSATLKEVFANDHENLLPVKLGANRSKGARGPSEYLPRSEYRCEYAAKWKHIARKYHLELDPDDESILMAILMTCP